SCATSPGVMRGKMSLGSPSWLQAVSTGPSVVVQKKVMPRSRSASPKRGGGIGLAIGAGAQRRRPLTPSQEKRRATQVPACPGGTVQPRASSFSSEILEVLAGFEAHGLAGRDRDLDAGLGIASDAFLAVAHLEDAESPQLDAFAVAQGALH